MKLFVCCLFVVANISYNGKASLESYAPTSPKVLFEDTTRNSDKSCHRPCKFNVKPRRCHFEFTIEPMIQDNGSPLLSINGMSPGPPIQVCANDVIVVEVRNKIPDQDVAIHWHGVEQNGSPHMDGVPMVTQCPITYGSSYKYAFIASSPGTFFYHADSVSHQSDGVYGPLIVNQPQPLEPHSALYDYDRSDESTFIMAARFPQLLTGNLEDMSQLQPSSLTINGHDENFKMFVMQGFSYRLRLVNAIAIECPVLFRIDQHEMVAIATDGKPVKPVVTKAALLYPGERMDVVVRASQESGGYWITASAGGACAGIHANAMMLYSGFNYTSMLQQGMNEISDEMSLDSSAIYGQMLESLPDIPHSPEVTSYYLGVDRNVVKYKEKDVDFRYISDAIPKKPFYPASLGHHSNESYTFHMHGTSVQVVSTWQDPQAKPISKKRFNKLNKEGSINRNLQNPPLKDTIVVPNKGYTIVRLRPDQGGSWLLECRSCSLSSLPAAVIINIPQKIPKSITKSLSKCGNYRPPDVLLN